MLVSVYAFCRSWISGWQGLEDEAAIEVVCFRDFECKEMMKILDEKFQHVKVLFSGLM